MKPTSILLLVLALLACTEAPEQRAGTPSSSPATASEPRPAAVEPEITSPTRSDANGNPVELARPVASPVPAAPASPQTVLSSSPLDQARRMTPAELKALLDAGEAVVVDVRNETQWEAGRIEGAVHIPSGEVFERAGELPREKWIAFYCT